MDHEAQAADDALRTDEIQQQIIDRHTNGGPEFEPTVEAGVVNALTQECWQTSEDHGFHEDWDQAAWLEGLASLIRGTTDKPVDATIGAEAADEIAIKLRQVAITLRTNIIGTKLMLMVSEVGEAMESLRDTQADGAINGEGNVPEELADVIVRAMDTAGLLHAYNLGDVLLAKMKKNQGRPFKHGRKL